MAKLYAIQQQIDGRWTRTGVGGERMLAERGASGRTYRPDYDIVLPGGAREPIDDFAAVPARMREILAAQNLEPNEERIAWFVAQMRAGAPLQTPVVSISRRAEERLYNRFAVDWNLPGETALTETGGKERELEFAEAYLGRPVRMVEIAHVACDPQRKRQDPPDPWWTAARAVPVRELPAVEDGRLAFFLHDERPTGFECTADEAAAVMAWAEALPGWEHAERPMRVEQVFDRRRRKERVKRYVGWSGPQLRIEEAG